MSEREALIEFANAVEAALVKLRRDLGDKPAVTHADQVGTSTTIAINESNFTALKWQQQHTADLGEFEAAYIAENDESKFQAAYNVLKAENASIKARYHGKTYAYAYWIWTTSGKIFRQKLKEQ